MDKVSAEYRSRLAGPPGDVYACDPLDHPGAQQKDMITIFWVPLK
jgi:hypothetical protein